MKPGTPRPVVPALATTTETRVLYADTDMMGVVYHATYLRYFEAGRGEYMRRRGMAYQAVEREGLQLPVIEARATYHRPARYDDLITVATWISAASRAQVEFSYVISRRGEPLVSGLTRHAAVTPAGRVVRLPEPLREALSRPEDESGSNRTH